jgi:hypothetical protein
LLIKEGAMSSMQWDNKFCCPLRTSGWRTQEVGNSFPSG